MTLRRLSKLTALSLTLMFGFVFSAAPSHASPSYSGALDSMAEATYGSTNVSAGSMSDMISQMVGIILGLVSVMLFCIMIYAGFLWMTAGGNVDSAKKAKDWLKNAAIGMLLIFSAYIIANLIETSATTILSNPAEEVAP
jgi:hypothetical protein